MEESQTLSTHEITELRYEKTDVVLECANGRIDAHQKILCKTSRYFKTMFSMDMLESETKTVKFKDVNVDAIVTVLSFLYRDDISPYKDLGMEDMITVVNLAHMMMIPELFDYFWDVLSALMLREQRFTELWDLAELYEVPDLRMNIVQSIEMNIDSLKEDSVNLLTPEQMQFFVSMAEASESVFRELLEWAAFDMEERSEILPEILKSFNFKNVTRRQPYSHMLRKLNRGRRDKIKLPECVSSVDDRNFYVCKVNVTTVQQIEKFCFEEKMWYLPRNTQVDLSDKVAWFPALSQDKVVFYFGNVRGKLVACSERDATVKRCHDKFRDNAMCDSGSTTAHGKFIYISNGTDTVTKFNVENNDWELLPVVTLSTNHEFLMDWFVRLTVRRDKLFFLASAYRKQFSKTKIFEYKYQYESKWKLITSAQKRRFAIDSKCLAQHCGNCKLYFVLKNDMDDESYWEIYNNENLSNERDRWYQKGDPKASSSRWSSSGTDSSYAHSDLSYYSDWSYEYHRPRYLSEEAVQKRYEDSQRAEFHRNNKDNILLETYDVDNGEWSSSVIVVPPLPAVRAIFAWCDRDCILFQSKSCAADFWVYHCEAKTWEKLPRPPANHLSLLSSDDYYLIDVC